MFLHPIFLPFLRSLGLLPKEDYVAGQQWRYKTRAEDPASTLVINKVESHPKLGSIFHISVLNVNVPNDRISSGVQTVLPHLPVSKKSLDDSVSELIGSVAIRRDYLEGYMVWKAEFDKGEAGIFTIPINEVVDVVAQSLSK